VIWSAVEIVSGVLRLAGNPRTLGTVRAAQNKKRVTQGKLIVLAQILVQAYAAKKILETGIRTQAVQRQARF
jgi:hypothetical protein